MSLHAYIRAACDETPFASRGGPQEGARGDTEGSVTRGPPRSDRHAAIAACKRGPSALMHTAAAATKNQPPLSLSGHWAALEVTGPIMMTGSNLNTIICSIFFGKHF